MEIEPQVNFESTEVAFSYKTTKELRKANFIFSLVNNPLMSGLARSLASTSIALHLPVKKIIKATIFDHFCGGETIDESEHTILQLARHGVCTILDYSAEGEKSEEGFDKTTAEILLTFDRAKDHGSVPFCVFKVTGMADIKLLEKIQTESSLSEKEEFAYNRIKLRVDSICAKANELKVPVLIDAEDSWIQNPIDEMVRQMMLKYNTEQAIVFNTCQMYRTDMLNNLKDAFHHAAMHNYFYGVKLVRGAYMEKERERAAKMRYPSPIHPSREKTDEAFNEALTYCINNKQRITVMCGSHNDYSNLYLTVLMQKHGMNPNDNRVWFAQLLGMSDHITFNLAKAGYHVAKYVPYGPVKSVMPYLLRRAEENTSVAGQSSRELSLIRKELQRRRASKS